MGAEHSNMAAASPPPTETRRRSAPTKPVSMKHIAASFEYNSTDVSVWPQLAPLMFWFTEQDAMVLYDKLKRRPTTRFLNVVEFRAWLSNDGQHESLLHPLRVALPVQNDILTPPAKLHGKDQQHQNPQDQNQQPQASTLLVLDLFLDHVFTTFAKGSTNIYAMEFLAAMVIVSRAIWSVEHKCRVLLTLFQDTANAAAHNKEKEPIFKEADLAQLFLCVMQGTSKATVGIHRVWKAQKMEISNVARRLAASAVHCKDSNNNQSLDNGAAAASTKVSVTATQLMEFVHGNAALLRFVSLFSGEELRNPFTFGGAMRCDGLSLPAVYRDALHRQQQQYETQLKQYVSMEGRLAKRRVSAALLIQSTWRRCCSQGLVARKKAEYQRKRQSSALVLQQFLRQYQFAKVLEQHAEAETNATNGGVFLAGSGPCIPGCASSSSQQPAPLKLVETFKLLNAKICDVALSRSCALALQSDRRTLFCWGRSLPRVCSSEANDALEKQELKVTLTQSMPSKLAFRFPSATPVLQLACGLSHALVLTSDGNVHSWGFNDHGQLGHGASETLLARTNGQKRYVSYYDERDAREYEYLAQPTVLVYFQGAPSQQADPIPIQSVVCGDYYSLALSREGDVFTWGEASEGQLGHGDAHSSFQVAFVDKYMLNSAYTYLPEPEPVLALSDQRVIQIACKKNHSVALTEHGRVFEWGNWGKRLGFDKEHAFTPVEMLGEQTLKPLQLRQISVGDHHMLGEGSSVWLTIPGRSDGLRGDKQIYLACSPSWSCGQDTIAKLFCQPNDKQWTCVFVDCDVDDIDDSDTEQEEQDDSALTQATARADAQDQDQDSRPLPSGDAHTLWKKRASTFSLSDVTQLVTYDAKFAHVFHCFPGVARKFGWDKLLMLWFHGHVQDRLVVMPRGKPAGYYLQILLPTENKSQVELEEEQDLELETPHAAGLPPMIEFPLCGSNTAAGKLTKRGVATHFFHAVMRERLMGLPRRIRKVMPMEYMEPNSISIVVFNESSCDLNDDAQESQAVEDETNGMATSFFTRSLTPDGKQAYEWSERVVEKMTRRVLAAQEAGALMVLIVLDFLDVEPFELDLEEDSGVYVPVFMVSTSTLSSRAPPPAPAPLDHHQPQNPVTFGEVLDRFLASQSLEDHGKDATEDAEADGRDQPPVLPPAWMARCFDRVDTTSSRIESAIANGAAGVILVQDEQSIEMDGETKGAPVFLTTQPPSSLPHVHTSDKLVAMISHSNSDALRAASSLSLTPRAMPFVKSDPHGAKCELLVDVTISIQPGGSVYAWGNGQNGRLGLGDPALSPLLDGYEALTDSAYRFVDKPTPIMALAGHPMKQIVCGSAHNVAVTEAGRVFTWGKGTRGELATSSSASKQMAQDQWVPRLLHSVRYERIYAAAANDASTALLTELVAQDVFLERRKEIAQLRAAAHRSLLP